jgi:hypothetical protein
MQVVASHVLAQIEEEFNDDYYEPEQEAGPRFETDTTQTWIPV